MEKILIIEDNKDVNRLIEAVLINAGYQTDTAYDGLDGMRKIREGDYTLVLLDIMLPYMSGDMILSEMRKFTKVPVMILSAKDRVETRIDMIRAGADDYLVKPFDVGEVLVRVEALLRRTGAVSSLSVLEYKDIKLYPDKGRVTVQDEEINLPLKEFQLLKLFMENQEKVFSKVNLYESVWNEEYPGDDNVIKAHLSNLRNKLKKANPSEDYIDTVWGIGYRLFR